MSARQQTREGRKALPIALIGQAIGKLTRHELEAVTERLIDRLDELSGDADLENYDENLEDDDPAGTDLDKGEDDGANGLSRLLPKPIYADNGHDQTIMVERHRGGIETKQRVGHYWHS